MPKGPALKARFIPEAFFIARNVSAWRLPRLESRFQRSFTMRLQSWGDAPSWYKRAPLALNRYSLEKAGLFSRESRETIFEWPKVIKLRHDLSQGFHRRRNVFEKLFVPFDEPEKPVRA